MAHRRSPSAGVRFLAAALIAAATLAAPVDPAIAQGRTATPNGHTRATRIGTVEPRLIGVPRPEEGGGALGAPTGLGGGAAALRSLRRPGASAPRRFDIPRRLSQGGLAARAAGSVTSIRASAAASASGAVGSGVVPAAAAPSGIAPVPGGTGLRSDLGVFGLSNADDSLLYNACSVFALCEEPPDPSVAVSATSVVESVNELTLIIDRATNGSRVVPNFDFFSLDNNQVQQTDPRVLYDQGRHRWLATEVSSDCSHSYLHFAVSASDDPFGTWTAYRIVFPDSVVDFPGVGTSSDTVVVSLNAYAPDAGSPDCLAPGDFAGGMLVVADWSDLTGAVASLPVTTTAPNHDLFTFRPATAAGGDALTRLVVAIDNGTDDTSDVGYATVSGTNAGRDVNLSDPVNLTKTAGLPAFVTPPQPRQPGDPATIAHAVDGQPTDAIAAGGRLWFISTSACTPGGEVTVRDCVRLTELTTGAGPTDVAVASDTLLQQRGFDLYMGGVGRALDGSLYLVYSRSSENEVVSGWATWRGPGDPDFHAASVVLPGAGTYSGSRWGDYVILSPDPAAPSAIWQTHEAATLDGSWFTWISRLQPAPTGSLTGTFRINGGDVFVGETFVDLQFANPLAVAATVVRVANDPAVKDGVLSAGLTLPIAADLPWSLDFGQPEAGAADGTRTIYVQWGDGQGNWSDVTSNSIILDTKGPTIGAFLAPQITASTLGANGSVPIDLHWGSGRDVLSGLEGYDVEVSRDHGDWATFATTGRPAASGRVASGHTYAFRVRSFDRLGNVSDFVESAAVRVTVLDDASAAITYSAGWRLLTGAGPYRSSQHSTKRDGETATFTFAGRAFAVVALVNRLPRGPGNLDVFVDGRRIGTVVESGVASVVSKIAFRADVTPGRHTVRLVAEQAAHSVNLDAVIVVR